MAQLEIYLCLLLSKFAANLPLPLLVFLCLHEQTDVEFSNLECLELLTAINLNSAAVSVPRSNIIVNKYGEAKSSYTVELSCSKLPKIQDLSSSSKSYVASALLHQKMTVLKTFGDFKRLYILLKQSDLICLEGQELPELPSKINSNGLKRPQEDLQLSLQKWLQELLQIPAVTNMLSFKFFFIETSAPLTKPEKLNRVEVGSLKIARSEVEAIFGIE